MSLGGGSFVSARNAGERIKRARAESGGAGERETYLAQLRAANVDPEAAEREATRRFGTPAVAIPVADQRALEKQVEHDCDVMMQELGFEVVRFSHPGKTQQTLGIPDRRYYRRPRFNPAASSHVSKAIAVWFECKSGSGEQRPGQALFQELVEACGEPYVLGGIEELTTWLVTNRIAERVGDSLRICL